MDAMTIAEKERRLKAIRRAYDTGALTVRHGDTTTTFRSLNEMERIISKLENELGKLQGKKPSARLRYPYQKTKAY